MTVAAQPGFESAPLGGQSKPRPHRATGRPRGGKRPGAGRKGTATAATREAAKRVGVSLRTAQRFQRVNRCSPTLAAEIIADRVTVGYAEQFIRWVLRHGGIPDQLREVPVVQAIVTEICESRPL